MSIRQWIHTLYNNVNAYVTNNGYCSESFIIYRGVRQGCPLSPYIFILCSELFCRLIQHDNNIRGLYINNIEIKISQYADDTVLFTDGSERSIDSVISALNKFSKVSGLVTNFDKSIAFFVHPTNNIYSQANFKSCLNQKVPWHMAFLCVFVKEESGHRSNVTIPSNIFSIINILYIAC